MSDDLLHPGGGCVAAVQFGAKTSCIDGCIFPNGTSAPAALGTCERAMAQRARSNAPEVEKTWWIDGDRRGDCRSTTDMDQHNSSRSTNVGDQGSRQPGLIAGQERW